MVWTRIMRLPGHLLSDDEQLGHSLGKDKYLGLSKDEHPGHVLG